jgi:hypothetical protein
MILLKTQRTKTTNQLVGAGGKRLGAEEDEGVPVPERVYWIVGTAGSKSKSI